MFFRDGDNNNNDLVRDHTCSQRLHVWQPQPLHWNDIDSLLRFVREARHNEARASRTVGLTSC